jgi:succinyl-CoA synthetase beta subunit/citryl-CoA synthetase large subunit
VVEFDGELGLLIGGGGASLVFFDALLDAGVRPANYCEIGGNPTLEKVSRLAELVLTHAKSRRMAVVMNVLNNTQADVIALGVLAAVDALGLEAREAIVAFRVPGSGEDAARRLLEERGVATWGRDVSLDAVAQLIASRMA